jgi:FAD/FMN-containing dehydrogenase
MGQAVTTLARQLRGELLLPADHGYDTARRGYNSLHDQRPAVIVRPADGDDEARALESATSAGLEIAVRSGGHSVAGYGATEGGALIDLSALHALHIDPETQLASVEAGTTAGQLTATSGAHGLVIPFGDCPAVGVGGISLGGGVGGARGPGRSKLRGRAASRVCVLGCGRRREPTLISKHTPDTPASPPFSGVFLPAPDASIGRDPLT